jgi:hypothetical protein
VNKGPWLVVATQKMKGADLILAKVMVFSMPFDRVKSEKQQLGLYATDL